MTSKSACKCCIGTLILLSQHCKISHYSFAFHSNKESTSLSQGWGGLEEVEGNSQQLINLNAMISGRTSISLRLSRRLFISLSEIGWRICERLVGGRKPAASVPKRWHRCPQDNQTVPRKKKKIKTHSPRANGVWMKLFMLKRRLRRSAAILRLKSYQFAAAEDLEAVAIVLYFIWMQPLGSTGLLELSKY